MPRIRALLAVALSGLVLAACAGPAPDDDAVSAALLASFAPAGITEIDLDTVSCTRDGAPDRQRCTIGTVTMRGNLPGDAPGSLSQTIAGPEISLGRGDGGVWEVIDITGGTVTARTAPHTQDAPESAEPTETPQSPAP